MENLCAPSCHRTKGGRNPTSSRVLVCRVPSTRPTLRGRSSFEACTARSRPDHTDIHRSLKTTECSLLRLHRRIPPPHRSDYYWVKRSAAVLLLLFLLCGFTHNVRM